ncbi:MAG: ABC-F family ATP-binding cassette domain-containing protein [Clostridia bacterium]|nr:ABC-F family ATP-binding cassette domain-containing protein [Clostridia bacterium]
MKASHLHLSFGTEVIYDDAEFQTNENDKVGIVGVNGAGKTTLFRVIRKELELDGGTISLGSANIGYLPQVIEFADAHKTVWDYLCEARPIKELEKRLEEIYDELAVADEAKQTELLAEIGKLQERLDGLDQYNAESTLLELIYYMNIDDSLLDMRIKDLSGGQKSKIAFARVLYADPKILLLDEPTNHLDATTKEFVTQYLKTYKGSVFVISHDVDFLNAVVNKILFINKVTHKISVYEGDYRTFKRKYAQEQLLKELRIAQQEQEIKKLSDFVQKARQASRTNHNLKRMGQDREAKLAKAIAALEKRDKEYKRVKMRLEPKRASSKIPLEVSGLTFGYPDKPKLYDKLSFILNADEKFLIVGENGVGKSTLLKLIMGLLAPNDGEIKFGVKTDVAYYAQELELLDGDKTVLENVDSGDYTDILLRNILGNFLFGGDTVYKKISMLSPGERARIALCKLLLTRANLLILDEPTNHLDPDTQAIIGENFRDYTGTIMLVSHNPDFVEQIGITRMLVLPDGKIMDYSRELLSYYYILNTDML